MFADDRKKGAKRERQFIDWCKSRKYPVLDLRDEFLSFDFAIETKQKKKIKIEVKSWTRLDSVVIEEDNRAVDGRDDFRKGWIYTTKADYVCFISNECMLFISVPKLRAWYQENKYRYRLCENQPSRIKGLVWQGRFRWVPVKDLPERIFVKLEL